MVFIYSLIIEYYHKPRACAFTPITLTSAPAEARTYSLRLAALNEEAATTDKVTRTVKGHASSLHSVSPGRWDGPNTPRPGRVHNILAYVSSDEICFLGAHPYHSIVTHDNLHTPPETTRNSPLLKMLDSRTRLAQPVTSAVSPWSIYGNVNTGVRPWSPRSSFVKSCCLIDQQCGGTVEPLHGRYFVQELNGGTPPLFSRGTRSIRETFLGANGSRAS
ncbi:hypothetical protein RRG08_063326 [Elysia crispata]|uniref:Uncharacterized protein n=1 Tax=Elysia crispata TaxID=231223 RepID=A0AAE0ZXV9_9GAST|nr:hypothetical protein RRG08_063326 [Elysia crispata]